MCKQLKHTLKMAELTAKSPSSDTPECCLVPCPAQPLGAAAQGETSSVQTKASSAHCLNHSLTFGVSVSQRAKFWQTAQTGLSALIHTVAPFLAPNSQQRLPNTRDSSTGHKLMLQLSQDTVHGVSSKTCKSSFLLQPVNSSPETLAHATDSSKAVISSQQARQTSGTATF